VKRMVRHLNNRAMKRADPPSQARGEISSDTTSSQQIERSDKTLIFQERSIEKPPL